MQYVSWLRILLVIVIVIFKYLNSITTSANTAGLRWCPVCIHTFITSAYYRLAGMFCLVNVWQIAELKVVGEKKFGKWIDFSHKDTIYKLNFGWSSLTNHQSFTKFANLSRYQTFLLCYIVKYGRLQKKVTFCYYNYVIAL